MTERLRRHLAVLVMTMATATVGLAPDAEARAPRGDEVFILDEPPLATASAINQADVEEFGFGTPASVSVDGPIGTGALTTSLELDSADGPPGRLTWRISGSIDFATSVGGGTVAVGALLDVRLSNVDPAGLALTIDGDWTLTSNGQACANLLVSPGVERQLCGDGGSEIQNVLREFPLDGPGASASVDASVFGDAQTEGAEVSGTAEFDFMITIGPIEPALECDIVGSGDDDALEGTTGDDVICGFGGADTLRGFGGNDVLVGGPGVDTLAGFDGDDLLLGGAGADVLFGDNGNDVSLGGPGDDRIIESASSMGDDTMFGCSGFDTIVGGPGDDTLGDAPPFPDSETATGEITLGDVGCDAAGSELAGDTIFGGPGADTITGGASRDELYGGTGADLIDGSAQRDLTFGCAGKDEIDGGGGNDKLFGESTAFDQEVAAENQLTGGDVDCSAVEGGRSPNTLTGGQGDDEITGGDGPDHVTGGKGSDKLRGGLGNDRLSGNQGFDIHLGQAGRDRILANDGTRDRVNGGPGRDQANTDPVDQVKSIEVTLRRIR